MLLFDWLLWQDWKVSCIDTRKLTVVVQMVELVMCTREVSLVEIFLDSNFN